MYSDCFAKTNPLKPVITFLTAAGLTHESVITVDVILTGASSSLTINITNNIPAPTTYTVTWYDEDVNTVLGTATYPYGSTPSYTGNTPVKAATAQYTYTFDKWEAISGVDANGTITSDASFKATYKASTNTYTVTWYDEDVNTVLDTATWPYGSTPSYSGNTPVKAATAQYTYTFDKWEAISGVDADGKITGDASYKATYKSVTNTYSVSFDANGGKGEMATQSFTYGETKTLTANTFTRSGYKFDGWNTAADGSGTAYEDGDSITVTGNLTLYAQWKKIRSSDVGLTITASSSIGGGITPIGETVVKRGCDKTYYISAPKGYTISRVLVDGVNVGAMTEYTFKNISSSHTIHVVFKASQLTVKDFLYGDYAALGALAGK